MKKLQRVKPFKFESSLILQQIKEFDDNNPCINLQIPETSLTQEFKDDIEILLGIKT